MLVDDFIIHIAPTIIGQGIPLFKSGSCEMSLELVKVTQFNQFKMTAIFLRSISLKSMHLCNPAAILQITIVIVAARPLCSFNPRRHWDKRVMFR